MQKYEDEQKRIEALAKMKMKSDHANYHELQKRMKTDHSTENMPTLIE